MRAKPLPLIPFLLLTICASTSLANPFDLMPANKAVEAPSSEKKQIPKRVSESTMTTTVKAPIGYIWGTLVDFDKYPEIFDRLQSVSVTKRDGNFVYIESHLKPHYFVKTEVQHTINDLAGKPEILKWELLDGNFKHIQGEWCLKALSANSTEVTYRLSVDPGAVIPSRMISFILHFVQREIVSSFVQYAEKSFATREKAQAL